MDTFILEVSGFLVQSIWLRFADAEYYYRRALDGFTRVLGPDHQASWQKTGCQEERKKEGRKESKKERKKDRKGRRTAGEKYTNKKVSKRAGRKERQTERQEDRKTEPKDIKKRRRKDK